VPDPLHPAAVAVLARRRPPWLPDGPIEVIWCATSSELAALARSGRLRGAVVEGLLVELDPELVSLVRAWCPVVVIDAPPARARWAELGAATLPHLPADLDGLRRALAEAGTVRRPPPRGAPDVGRAALVALLAAPGGNGASTAVTLAGSLVLAGAGSRVVLADLTLDAPHRALHGLAVDRAGVPELVRSARFGAPPSAAVRGALHPTAPGYRVLPGLLRHHDWVTVGEGAATRVLAAVRHEAEVVVAHIDRDLEGEPDTGSYDIEDRNVLARTTVRTSDLVVVAAGGDRSARLGLVAVLGSLAAHGVPHGRTIVVMPRAPSRRAVPAPGPRADHVLRVRPDRADRRVGRTIIERLRASGQAD
jgi:hypothetical protein